MKFNILIALFISAFCFNSIAFAQEDASLPPTLSESKEDNVVEGKKDNDKKETVFSKASDKQIKEANIFYESCIENETMSKLRDCKCAATAFLEKRMELGDDPPVKKIISANSDKCLKNDDDVIKYKSDDDFDTSEITEDQLKEADAILLRCESTIKLSRNYDCECYAAKFLDERIKQGPFASKEAILQSFYNDCRNIVETTGYEYNQCMKTIQYMPVRGHEPKPFCECYARKWAKLFENYEGTIDMSSKKQMRIKARAACMWPDKGP